LKSSSNLVKLSFFYTVANGINRASAFIYIPFLLRFLNIDEFGNFSLVQSISQLLIPIFLISSTSGIIRELKKGIESSFGVYKTFSTQIIFLNVVFSSAIFMWNIDNIYLYSILLGLAGGVHELNLAWFKANESFKKFTMQVLLRVLSLLVLFISTDETFSLFLILKYQYIITFATGFLFQFIELKLKYRFEKRTFIEITSYTLYIIPHGMGIWALSSSDRLIVKYLTNDHLLGYYSLAYSIAMLLSFLNTGLASTLPQIIAKDYNDIDVVDFGKKTIKMYSIASVTLFIIIITGITLDKYIFNILKYHSNQLYFVFFLAYMGLYMLGPYYFISYFLIYFKKTLTLAKISLLTAVINIFMTMILVIHFSIIGAAVSTFISYTLYFIMVYKKASSLNNDLTKLRFPIVKYCTVSLFLFVLIFVIVYYFIRF
jgi:O-antigen/teichoic acid export membrane protein